MCNTEQVGGAVGVGEQPIKGLLSAAAGARLSVAEALTNLVFAPITELADVKCSANWMWPAKLPGEGQRLVQACQAMCELMKEVNIAVDGGKDSLSMAATVQQQTVKSPGTLVISAYAPCTDIRRVLTPDLKCPQGKGTLLYIRFGACMSEHRLGGSALGQCYNQLGDTPSDIDDPLLLGRAFAALQHAIHKNLLTAGHDVSDGGLITAVLEMAFAGNCALDVNLPFESTDSLSVLFAEESAVVVECSAEQKDQVLQILDDYKVPVLLFGHSLATDKPNQARVRFVNFAKKYFSFGDQIRVSVAQQAVVNEALVDLRLVWEETSHQLDKLQTASESCAQNWQWLTGCKPVPWNVPEHLFTFALPPTVTDVSPRVAVVREEGSNGDREMAAAFYTAGFTVVDVTMQDLLCDEKMSFDSFRGLAFVGGFSYADVLGSAKGWSSSIRFNKRISDMFSSFYNRSDTFSLGVCNGCQLMAAIGWVGHTDQKAAEVPSVQLQANDCGRFVSDFVSVRIGVSRAIMLQAMHDVTIGVWVAHGEGKFQFSDEQVLNRVQQEQLVCMQYVDADNTPTTLYPLNPNGSQYGIAAVCSVDGRHLAMMPHPERTTQTWHWPYWPSDWPSRAQATSPWLQMFKNAHKWCTE